MKAPVLTTILACFPALLAAQQTSATASATTQTNVSVPASYSGEGRAKIEAAFQTAREKKLPDQPMRDRMAEGQAKGATEAQVVSAVQQTEARLEASQSALIRAGRADPQPSEVASAEQALASGATAAQIEAVVKNTPAGEPLVFGAAGALNGVTSGANGAVNAAAGAAAKVGADGKGGVTGAVKGAVSGVVPPKKP